MDNRLVLNNALEKLAASFAQRQWPYLHVPKESRWAKTFQWPGKQSDSIMICVHKGTEIQEEFHRQDFFFFNFAYLGSYGAFSANSDHYIVVQEDECYIGQPYTGYALSRKAQEEFIIIGVLIQKESFFKTFLPVLSADPKLFQFFLDPQTNEFSEDFIHLRFDDAWKMRVLLEIMVIEYASEKEDVQTVLQPLVLSLLLEVARQYKRSAAGPPPKRLSDRIVQYISTHSDRVSLQDLSKHFMYHPNYISTLLRKETGHSFSEILLEQRMQRALSLLKGTTLTIEEIAAMLGYNDTSNFYKFFHRYYGKTPREYMEFQKDKH